MNLTKAELAELERQLIKLEQEAELVLSNHNS